MSAGRLTLIAALIDAYIAAGIWTLIDDEQPLCAENAPQALTSLKQRRLATVTAAPTFTADAGYAFNGTTQFINTGFVPSTMAVGMNANNVRVATYERTNVAANSSVALGCTAAAVTLNPRNGSGIIQSACFSSSINVASSITDSRGLTAVSRAAAATTINGWKNGVALAGGTSAPGGALGVNAIYIGARNSAGTADQFRAATEGWTSWGAPLSTGQEASYYTALQTFMTAIGANV